MEVLYFPFGRGWFSFTLQKGGQQKSSDGIHGILKRRSSPEGIINKPPVNSQNIFEYGFPIETSPSEVSIL